MSDFSREELDFVELAERTQSSEPAASRASSRLRSRLLTSLVNRQAASGPLLSLKQCAHGGAELCPFEKLVAIAPVGEHAGQSYICNVCHARLLAERFEPAPIWWPGCPYSQFQKT